VLSLNCVCFSQKSGKTSGSREPKASNEKEEPEPDTLMFGVDNLIDNLNKVNKRLQDSNIALRRRISALQIAAEDGWGLADAFIEVTETSREVKQLVQARELLEAKNKKLRGL